MDTKTLESLIPEFIERLEEDGYSWNSSDHYRRILQRFQSYCEKQGITEVSEGVIKNFLMVRYGIAVYTGEIPSKYSYTIRKALLSFWEYANTGTYGKQCITRASKVAPEQFTSLFEEYVTFVSSLGLARATTDFKIAQMHLFLEYLDRQGFESIQSLENDHIYDYLSSEKHSGRGQSREYCVLKKALDWLHERGMIGFSSREAFPALRAKDYPPIPSAVGQGVSSLVLAQDKRTDPLSYSNARVPHRI